MNKRTLLSLLAPAALLGAVFVLAFHEIWDRDVFFHLAHGRALLEHGVPLPANLFVWAPSELPFYQNPAWLFGIMVALVHAAAGLGGVVALKCLVFGLLFLCLYRMLREDEVPPPAAASMLFLVAMGSSLRMNERPEIFTFFFFGLLAWRVGRYRAGEGGQLWWLPVLLALWANLHSGFIFGLLFLLLVLGGELLTLFAGGRWPATLGVGMERQRLRHLALVVALAGAATFVAPQPLGNYRFLFQHLHVTSVVPVAEYGFPTPELVPWFYLLLAAAGLLLLCRPRTFPPATVLPALFFLLLAFTGVRFIPLCAIALLPLLAPRLAALGVTPPFFQDGSPRRWPWLKTILGGVLPLLLVLIPLLWPPVPGRHVVEVNRTQTPLDAFRFLQAHPVQGNLYNSMSFGAAGMFYLYPQYRLYQSSYIQVEEDRQAEAHLAAKAPQTWQEFLDRHRIDVALIDTKFEEPSPLNFPPQQWAMVFFDDVAAIYARRGGANEIVIAAHEYQVIHPAAILGVGAINIDLTNYRRGLEELQRALRESPDSFLVHLLLGYYYSAVGERDAALHHFTRAAALNPEASPAHFQRGLLLLDLERPTEAAAALEIYVRREPSDPLGYLYLAKARQVRGAAAAAMEILEQGLAATGEQAALRHHLGVLLRERGDLDGALANLQRAAQLAPNNPPVLNDLGVCLELRGDLPGALAAFESALALQPDAPKIIANREQVLQKLRLSPKGGQ